MVCTDLAPRSSDDVVCVRRFEFQGDIIWESVATLSVCNTLGLKTDSTPQDNTHDDFTPRERQPYHGRIQGVSDSQLSASAKLTLYRTLHNDKVRVSVD